MADRYDALLLTEEGGRFAQLKSGLDALGIDCAVSSYRDFAAAKADGVSVDIILVHVNGHNGRSTPYTSIVDGGGDGRAPVIALLSKESLSRVDAFKNADDFVMEPYDAAELAARARRIRRNGNGAEGHKLITCGDLVIDLNECAVRVGGKLVDLTFREYELLRFLAGNPGRVFSRDALLDKVWGYDFYGGDRTVDVHVRRLRSKIEDNDHVFIETLRNIGYRFKKEA
ncbi:MAG: response regulator transcription factor [Dehalococcoidia bacterium]|jgi:DNA-binding response OmpR family regulator